VLGGLFAWLAERGGVPILPAAVELSHCALAAVCCSLRALVVLTWFSCHALAIPDAPVKKRRCAKSSR